MVRVILFIVLWMFRVFRVWVMKCSRCVVCVCVWSGLYNVGFVLIFSVSWLLLLLWNLRVRLFIGLVFSICSWVVMFVSGSG